MNPELQRNLWLEATPRRVSWVIVALALVLGAIGLITGMSGAPAADVGHALGIAGGAVFVVSALIWGAREAGQAVMEEIGARTWEFQRLSALTPWTMTWGKLFGATSVAWLAALVGLVFAAADAGARNGAAEAALMVVSGLALAVIFHAVAMSSALIGVRKARAEGRLATLRGSIFGFIFLLLIVWQVASLAGLREGLGLLGNGATVSWFGQPYGRSGFLAVSLVLFALWAVSGAWRLMRLELQTRNAAWWWPAFLVFTAIWTAGLADEGASRWLAALVVFVAGAYVSAFAEPADRIRLRQFAQSVPSGDVERTLTLTPAVVPALLLAVVAALAVSVIGPAGEAVGDALVRNSGFSLFRDAGFTPAWALIAFLIRDLGVIAYFRFGARPRRGDFGAVVALGVLYLVGGGLGQAFGDDVGGALFFPHPQQPVVSLISAALQAFLIWTLATRRIAGPERARG